MLVITRKNGERLIIGHDIEVTVLKIQGNRVKLGIRGPADVPIHRKELQARILHPSPDTSCGRTLSAGPTAEEQGEEEWGPPSLGSRARQCSGIATIPRRRLVHDEETADRRLERRIRNFLEGLNLPALRDLEVEVRNGAAVITGRVSTFYQKQLATSCCQRVAGVLSVLNEVRVADSPVTDSVPPNRDDGPQKRSPIGGAETVDVT
jgi:carbon storage regulator